MHTTSVPSPIADERLPVEGRRALARLLPRIEERYAALLGQEEWADFRRRLETHYPRLFDLLVRLYGSRFDLYYHLEELLALCAQSRLERPAALRELDRMREAD
jgi:hypothetical protein